MVFYPSKKFRENFNVTLYMVTLLIFVANGKLVPCCFFFWLKFFLIRGKQFLMRKEWSILPSMFIIIQNDVFYSQWNRTLNLKASKLISLVSSNVQMKYSRHPFLFVVSFFVHYANVILFRSKSLLDIYKD